MQSLSAHTLLHLWEVGQRQHTQERIVSLLSAALPEASRSELLNLSVGQRDTYLLRVRESLFGPQFAGYAECLHCQERIECTFSIADIWAGTTFEQVGKTRQIQLELGDYTLEVRLPTQADLLAITPLASVSAARSYLLEQCIYSATYQGVAVAVLTLPEEILAALGEQMTIDDPQAETLLTLTCPACERHLIVLFDIATWLWTEVTTQAKRLLREVHTLALAYGWSEADILAMSAFRRQCYLEMVS